MQTDSVASEIGVMAFSTEFALDIGALDSAWQQYSKKDGISIRVCV